jgi:hypothetical protein
MIARALRLALAVCALLASVDGPAAAQSKVEPDRPGATNGTRTVPPGAAQIEAGLAYARASVGGSPDERRLSVEALVRAGLTERLEARLGGEPFVRLRGAQEDTGHGDVTLELKLRLLDARDGAWWPALGVLPSVKLPVADEPIGSERADYALLGLASFTLPWDLGLDVNAGPALIGQTRPNGYLVQALTSASLSKEWTDRLASFVEILFASRAERGGRDALGLNAGLTYFVSRALALDAAAETSLAGPGPDWALRAGFSVRFGR